MLVYTTATTTDRLQNINVHRLVLDMAQGATKDPRARALSGEGRVRADSFEGRARAGSLNKKTKVLIAVDDGQPAMDAFHYYLRYMYKEDHDIILLHCGEMSNVSMRLLKGDKAPYEENWEKMWSGERIQWQGIRAKFLKEMREKQIRGKFEVVLSSKPGHAILQEAEKHDVTMVVMGCRHMGSVHRTFLGSTSDYVMHHAHIPVAVCR